MGRKIKKDVRGKWEKKMEKGFLEMKEISIVVIVTTNIVLVVVEVIVVEL